MRMSGGALPIPNPQPHFRSEGAAMADGDLRTNLGEPPRRNAGDPDHPSLPPGVGPDPTVPAGIPAGAVLIPSVEARALGVDHDEAGASSLGGGGRRRFGDRLFVFLTSGASGIVILIVVLVAIFLVVKSIPTLRQNQANFLTSTEWDLTPGDLHFGVASLLYTTVAISLLALLIAVPLAIGIALFITQYAPARLARPTAYTIDLLAAIPSIIYGIWGARVLAPHLTGTQDVLSKIGLGLFAPGFDTGTVFDGGIVLAIMILPIITAISRDVFDRTPRANIEAALALGATRWEVIRMAVLPYGRAGVVSGSMLGLGRALGETIAIAFIVSKVSTFSPSLFSGGETFASKIANNAAEFNSPTSTGAYIAAGLVLFVLTFVVNAAARAIVNRKKDFV
jgi:phosphate transport system permease protein